VIFFVALRVVAAIFQKKLLPDSSTLTVIISEEGKEQAPFPALISTFNWRFHH
jgi:hypothetical protein